MQVLDAITKLVNASGRSWRDISATMGKSDNYLSATVAQSKRKAGDVRSATLAEFAAACGYVLALVPVDQLPESAVVIDAPSREVER